MAQFRALVVSEAAAESPGRGRRFEAGTRLSARVQLRDDGPARALEARVSRMDNQLGALLRNVAIIPALNDPDAPIGNVVMATVTTVKLANLRGDGGEDCRCDSYRREDRERDHNERQHREPERADKIVAGLGIINNLTINATLTIGAGGSIVDADGLTWGPERAAAGERGRSGRRPGVQSGRQRSRVHVGVGRFEQRDSAPRRLGRPIRRRSCCDGQAVPGSEGLGFNTLRPRVTVTNRRRRHYGNTAPDFASGRIGIFLADALIGCQRGRRLAVGYCSTTRAPEMAHQRGNTRTIAIVQSRAAATTRTAFR